MKLRYTLRAAEELVHILSHIDEHSPQGAHHVKTRIRAIIDLIALHPHAGQLTDTRRLRRLIIHPYPYVIFYAAVDDEVVIHGLRHAARRPSSMPD
ncbi:MAG TPA: type II toxin-antitoxin system RelE/ParE family toxin [Roseiarcus sp.]